MEIAWIFLFKDIRQCMILCSFPYTILLEMNCGVRCIHTVCGTHHIEVLIHLNSDIDCDCYITKHFTFSIQYLSATDSMANLRRLEIYRQYIGARHSLNSSQLKRFPALVSSLTRVTSVKSANHHSLTHITSRASCDSKNGCITLQMSH